MAGVRHERGEATANSGTHPKPGTVTVAGHPSDDVKPGTWNSILKQAGLKERDKS